jgi:hypothetical protein
MSASEVADRRGNDADPATQDDAKQREVLASADVVEAALAKAIDAEVQERRAGWEARVALLAGELQARRLARGGVVARRRETTTVESVPDVGTTFHVSPPVDPTRQTTQGPARVDP